MTNIAYKGRVYGRVQGVGFRYFTQEHAVMLSLVGYVKNMPDDSVEFLIQGTPSQCDALLAKIKNGPPFAKVDTCDYLTVELDSSFSAFNIYY